MFALSSSTRAERTVRSSHDADLGPLDAVQAMTLRILSLLDTETMQFDATDDAVREVAAHRDRHLPGLAVVSAGSCRDAGMSCSSANTATSTRGGDLPTLRDRAQRLTRPGTWR